MFMSDSTLRSAALWAALAWGILELLFWAVLKFIIVPSLHKPGKPLPFHHSTNPKTFIFRVLDLLESLPSYEYKHFIKGFFRGAEVDDLAEGNIRSFLAWAMFSCELDELREGDKKTLEEVYDEVKKRYPISDLKQGHNTEVSHVNMTLQPVPYLHRPLFIYTYNIFMETLFQITFYYWSGFQRGSCGGLTYWHRKASTSTSRLTSTTSTTAQPPLLLLHGITPGWRHYFLLFKAILSKHSDRDCFLIDLDGIKINSLCFFMPSPEDFAHAVSSILASHGHRKCCVIGHSFGTITAGNECSAIS